MPRSDALLIGNTDGIGRALTHRLLAGGQRVIGISRRASDLEHDAYTHHVLDVTDPRFLDELHATLGRHGTPQLCVYCAGIGHGFDPEEIPAERAVMEVNLMGLVRTVEAVIPRMLQAGTGHLIGLSSIADVLLGHDAVSYYASKAGMSRYLNGLGLALRKRRSGVFVTNVRFGFVDTKMAQAPARPLMISAERAVDLVLRCVRRRPVQFTYPRTMNLLALALRAVAEVRLFLSG